MARNPQVPRDFPALERLAQTRAEIIDLIAPELAYGDVEDAYGPSPRPTSSEAFTAASRGAPGAATWSSAEREAVAAWADDTMPPTRARRAADRTTTAAAGAAGWRGFGGPVWGPMLRQGASIWWRHHPAHAAFSVADSALSLIAGRKPYLMLGVAAGFGALLMWIRPWRLVSITGLIFAALKMSDLRAVFGSIRRGG